MSDVTIKRFDELESYGGLFHYAGKGIGVSAWGMNVLELPPRWADYPEHDHAGDGQEEAYLVLEGSAVLSAGGGRVDARAGHARARRARAEASGRPR